MSNLCRPRRSGNCASLSPPQPQDEAVALLREVIERDGVVDERTNLTTRIRAYLAHMGGREAK